MSVAQLLLADPRVDPTASDNWAIRCASYSGDASVVELLLADSRFSQTILDKNVIESAIALASNNGHSKVVEILNRVDRPEDTLVDPLDLFIVCLPISYPLHAE